MLNKFFDSGYQNERRVHQRMQFRCMQMIAPLRGGKLPSAEDFFEVHCNDLTPSGFSFFFPRNPNFVRLVIALEKPDEPRETIYLTAEIRNRHKVVFCKDTGEYENFDNSSIVCGEHYESNNASSVPKAGEDMILVGCLFTGRVD